MKNTYSINQERAAFRFNQSKLIIVLIIGQFLLFSCGSLVKEIDPSFLPETDSKLVVACFISPQDTVLAAKVTETRPFFGTAGACNIKDDITNAIVNLSDGSKTIQLIYNAKLGYYSALPATLPISAGKTYNITVSTPDGRKVNATSTVPNSIAIKEVKIDSTQTTDNQQSVSKTKYTAKLIWQDVLGETNYYRGINIFETIIQYPDNYTTVKLPPFPPLVIDLRTIDDKNSDGKLLSLSRTFEANYSNISYQNSKIKLVKQFKIGLFQTDIHYYKYHSTLQKYLTSLTADNDSVGEPIIDTLSEPFLLYTNINGGFGCFGAYNATWQEFKVK
jgi:hypothetical protein